MKKEIVASMVMDWSWYLLVFMTLMNIVFMGLNMKSSYDLRTKIDELERDIETTKEAVKYIIEETKAWAVPEIDQGGVPEPVEAPGAEISNSRGYFNVPMDEALQDHVMDLCEIYNVDCRIIFAMIDRESKWDSGAVGDSGRSLGLMQIQPRWHKDRMARLGVNDLLNPYQNVKVGIDLFAELLDQGGTLEWALMAYNGGPSYANKLEAQGKISGYAQYVIEYASELERR